MTPREIADAKKRTCSRCARGHHELCTLAMCAHYLCVTDEDGEDAEPNVEVSPSFQVEVQIGDESFTGLADVVIAQLDGKALIWETPPGRRSGRAPMLRPTPGQAEMLRTRPGEFARIHTFAGKHSGSQAAAQLTKGKSPTPPGQWEFKGAVLEDGSSGLWCRFLGQAE